MLMTGELHSRHLVVIIRTESFDPCRDRRSCWFRQLELDRPLSLFLNHRSTGHYLVAVCDVPNAKAIEIASARFAIDGEIEQRGREHGGHFEGECGSPRYLPLNL